MIRKVAVLGHPILRKKAKPVDPGQIKSESFQALLSDMVDTMYEYDGRGLAAPQIHESLQVFVALLDFDESVKNNNGILFLINPQVEVLTTKTSSYWEGCLSLPGLRGLVERPNKISVKALNHKNEKLDFIAEGFLATVIQHEWDHLNGILYIDRMKDLKNLSFSREFERYHQGEQTQVLAIGGKDSFCSD